MRLRKLQESPKPKGKSENTSNKTDTDSSGGCSCKTEGSHSNEALEKTYASVPAPRGVWQSEAQILASLSFDPDTIVQAMNAARRSPASQNIRPLSATGEQIIKELSHWRDAASAHALIIFACNSLENCFLSPTAMCTDFLMGPPFDPQSCIVIACYCGYYKDRTVMTLAIDLYGQLVKGGNAAESRWMEESQRPLGLDAMLSRIKHCIHTGLQRAPIFCFIDCLHEYQFDQTKKSDMGKLLMALSEFTNSRRANPLKLLVTSRGPSLAQDILQSTGCAVSKIVLDLTNAVIGSQ